MNDTFTCDYCHGTFEKGWTDEEADAELRENFGLTHDETDSVACDDCYNKIMERIYGGPTH